MQAEEKETPKKRPATKENPKGQVCLKKCDGHLFLNQESFQDEPAGEVEATMKVSNPYFYKQSHTYGIKIGGVQKVTVSRPFLCM